MFRRLTPCRNASFAKQPAFGGGNRKVLRKGNRGMVWLSETGEFGIENLNDSAFVSGIRNYKALVSIVRRNRFGINSRKGLEAAGEACKWEKLRCGCGGVETQTNDITNWSGRRWCGIDKQSEGKDTEIVGRNGEGVLEERAKVDGARESECKVNVCSSDLSADFKTVCDSQSSTTTSDKHYVSTTNANTGHGKNSQENSDTNAIHTTTTTNSNRNSTTATTTTNNNSDSNAIGTATTTSNNNNTIATTTTTNSNDNSTIATIATTTTNNNDNTTIDTIATTASSNNDNTNIGTTSDTIATTTNSNDCHSASSIFTSLTSVSNSTSSSLSVSSSTESSSLSFSSSVIPSAVSSADGGAFTETAGPRMMKPKELVEHLDNYIIGQAEAKRAVANALRNRWRRQQLQDINLKEDVVPKNILMIGPTGVGKTEIARKLSKVVDAPFIKVEATKFTEVGFHGRDVDQIIKDLVEIAIKQQKSKTELEYRAKAEESAEHSILETLLGKLSKEDKQSWLGHLRMGLLDDRIIQVDVPVNINPNNQAGGGSMFGSDAIDAIADAVSSLSVKPFKVIQGRGTVERRSLSVKDAKNLLIQAQLDTMINQDVIVKKALDSVEQEGIVFVDEIDKICTKGHGGYTGPDASAEGVQRDLLPLIEGSTITTKYGNVKTDYILFVASGAFHSVKPSDMLAELQGRLPVRVELKPLTTQDFVNILTRPKHNLLKQNKELLSTEGIELEFTEDAILEIAKVSSEVNTHVENIGARRLHTIIEKIMEEINYEAPGMQPGTRIVVDVEKVRSTVGEYLKKTDLHKFIL